jgi:multiple sugar transport system substrate-binding protein
MMSIRARRLRALSGSILIGAVAWGLAGCGEEQTSEMPRLSWYVFDEQSGAFAEAAERCAEASAGTYTVELVPLPADADQQREQLVRRLAAGDPAIDLIGMDVIWTAEFAAAGWIQPWPEEAAERVRAGRLEAAIATATYRDRLWAIPFTSNTQLLWYRTDRVDAPPATWDEMIDLAESLGEGGTIRAQGERYEGFSVFFVSLLASAGGAILTEDGRAIALPAGPTRAALRIMRRLGGSTAAPPGLARAREDQARLGFESGDSAFMINYTYVWPSARANAPQVAERMGWARWPAVSPDRPSRVTIGGVNLGVGAFSRHPELARRAAECIAGETGQHLAATQGGLPPTLEALYDAPEVRATFPFAEVLRETLRDAVHRPHTPYYNDLSLAIGRVLHPMSGIDVERDLERLRDALSRALPSE